MKKTLGKLLTIKEIVRFLREQAKQERRNAKQWGNPDAKQWGNPEDNKTAIDYFMSRAKFFESAARIILAQKYGAK